MNLYSDDIELEEVLYRYFRNELSNEEKIAVDAWKSDSAKNEEVFNEQQLLFLDMKGLSFYQNLNELNADKSWDNFSVSKNIKSTKSFTFMRYAASIAIVVSAVIGVYLYQNRSNEVSIAEIVEVKDIQLADGTAITLNEGSSLKYVEPFANNERRVQLEGEGYFDVAKNPEMPFVIEVQDVEVRVLGTKFFINEPAENEIDVVVEEGKVLVSYKDLHEIVEAGQSTTVDMAENIISEKVEDEIGSDTFWKTRRLVFNETTLVDVATVINNAYNTSITLEGASDSCLLTVTFENESLENILEVVSSTLNFEVVKDQGSIILKGNGCE